MPMSGFVKLHLQTTLFFALGRNTLAMQQPIVGQVSETYEPLDKQLMQQVQALPPASLASWDQEASPLGFARPSPILQQLPQPFQDQVAAASEPEQAQAVSVQDVLGLVGSMGEQQRKEKSIEAELLKAREHEKQLNGMVLSQTYLYNTIDQNARKLATQAQQTISLKEATVDHLRKEVADLKNELDSSHKHLADLKNELDSSHKHLAEKDAELSLAQQREQEAVNEQQVTEQRAQEAKVHAEQRAKAAEARARNALKAAELEDSALKQQQMYLKGLTHEHEELTDMDDTHDAPSLKATAATPKRYPPTNFERSSQGSHSQSPSGHDSLRYRLPVSSYGWSAEGM